MFLNVQGRNSRNIHFKSIEDVPNSAFSSVSYKVLHVDDVRAYIHCIIEETGNEVILSLYNKHIRDKDGNPKPEYAQLQRKSFMKFFHFLLFDEGEWVRYILSHVHDDFI